MARNQVQLKSIKVCSFRSFRRETEIDFGEGVNVLVGENGAGKSSVVAALEFALCGDTNHYKPSELKQLRCYYEYKGSRNNPTFVEVCLEVFENNQSDSREVIIRREFVKDKVTLKIDNSPATMKDLIALGFKWKDFVVKQGQVAGISNAKPEELLKLFEDLSGAVVLRAYSEELTKSLNEFSRSLQRAAIDAEEVQNMIDFVNITQGQRKQYRVKDDQRRAIEYVQFSRKRQSSREKLEQLRREYDRLKSEREAARAPQVRANEDDDREMGHLEKETLTLSYQLKLKRVQEESLEKQNRERFLDMETYKTIIADLQQKVCVFNIKEQSSSVQKRTAVDPEYQSVRKEYLNLVNSKPFVERAELEYNQQVTRYKSTASSSKELEVLLQSTIREYDHMVEKQEKRLKTLEDGLESVKKSLLSAAKSLRIKVQDIATYKHAIKTGIEARLNARRDVNRVESEYRTLGIQNDESKADMLTAEENTRQSYLQLQEACGLDSQLAKQVLEMIYSLQKGSHDFEDRCHGFLINSINYEERMAVAVETALGRKLFSVVVDDVQTVLEILNYDSVLDITAIEFVCLEAFDADDDEYSGGLGNYENVKYPLEEHFEVTSHLCPEKITSLLPKAVLQLCPNVALCRKPSEISNLMSEFEMMGIEAVIATHRGVKISTAGHVMHYIHAGAGQVRETCLEFRDTYLMEEDARYIHQSSELELQEKRKMLNKMIKNESKAESTVNLNIYRLNQGRKDQLFHETEVVQLERREESLLNQILESKNLLEYQKKIRMLLREACLQAEELYHGSMDDSGETTTGGISNTILEHQKAVGQKLSELQFLRLTVLAEEDDVEDENMLTQSQGRDQLERGIEENKDLLSSVASEMRACEIELTKIRKDINNIRRAMQTIENQKESLHDRRRLVSQQIVSEADARIQTIEVEISELENSLLETFKEPWKEDIVSSLEHLSDNELLQQYKTIVKEMKKLDQNSAIMVTEDQIELYQEEIDRIHVLQQECEIGRELVKIVRTKLPLLLQAFLSRLEVEMRNIYDTISSDRTIYIRLVSQEEEEFSLLTLQNSPDLQERLATGDIKGAKFVMLAKSGEESWSLSELSGGQRSMISLTMILALQKLRPVPFLVFDEVDAALDKPNRDVLNTLICSAILDEKQLICTTFRPELTEIASTHLRVKFSSSNKSSVVAPISKEEALAAVSSCGRR